MTGRVRAFAFWWKGSLVRSLSSFAEYRIAPRMTAFGDTG
jgi:hypothetical protein